MGTRVTSLPFRVLLAGAFAAAAQAVSADTSCAIDAACDPAGEWSDDARAVVRLVIAGGHVCTGTLLNNTARDLTPYVLTAHHCVPDEAAAQSVVVYWNDRHAACGSTERHRDQVQNGATLVAADAATDFALLRLHQRPPAEFAARYAGWDRRDRAPASAVAIHHGWGEPQSVSVALDAPRTTAAFSDESSGDGAFLRVEWNGGITGPGSSGAALWDDAGRVVGQYSGGYGTCADPQPDWFGRLARAWNPPHATGDSQRLRPHLDPAGTGAETLDSFDTPPVAVSDDPEKGGRHAGGAPALAALLALALAAVARARKTRPITRPTPARNASRMHTTARHPHVD